MGEMGKEGLMDLVPRLGEGRNVPSRVMGCRDTVTGLSDTAPASIRLGIPRLGWKWKENGRSRVHHT